ncbi:MAG: hypothetical protein AABX04_04185 [Nanoarchaeota archaeon]
MGIEILTEKEFRERWTIAESKENKLLPDTPYKEGVSYLGEIRDEAAVISDGFFGCALDSRFFDGLCGYDKELHGRVASQFRDIMIAEAEKRGANVLIPTVYETVPNGEKVPVAGYAFRIER